MAICANNLLYIIKFSLIFVSQLGKWIGNWIGWIAKLLAGNISSPVYYHDMIHNSVGKDN